MDKKNAETNTTIRIYTTMNESYNIQINQLLSDAEVDSFVRNNCQMVDRYEVISSSASFGGKLFCGGEFLGYIQANNLNVLEKIAETKCNKYCEANKHLSDLDQICLTRMDNKSVKNLSFIRMNIIENGSISWGKWEFKAD